MSTFSSWVTQWIMVSQHRVQKKGEIGFEHLVFEVSV